MTVDGETAMHVLRRAASFVLFIVQASMFTVLTDPFSWWDVAR